MELTEEELRFVYGWARIALAEPGYYPHVKELAFMEKLHRMFKREIKDGQTKNFQNQLEKRTYNTKADKSYK